MHSFCLAERKTTLQTEKEQLLATLRDVFAEKKRYEILHQQHLTARKKQQRKKEQANLDDMASVRR